MKRTKKNSRPPSATVSRANRQKLLHEEFLDLGHRLSSASSSREAARIILKAADRIFGWDCGYLLIYSPEENRAYPVLTMDIVDKKKVEFPSPYAPQPLTPLASQVLRRGAQLKLRSESDHSPHGMIPFGNTSRLSASIMIVPIRNKKKVTGFLSVDSYSFRAYDRDDLMSLQSLADYCGGALERIAAQEALRKSEAKLRDLAARLQSVREEESIRIAREIHDEMGQTITGLKIDLRWLQKKLSNFNGSTLPLAQKIESMVQITDDAIKSVRRICTELRPGILDDLGLVAAIDWQAHEFEARTGLQCELSLPKISPPLDQPRATAVFRIFQEILNNIVRHAHATRVFVKLKKDREHLILEVRDNGRGIAEKEIIETKSLGLIGMKERALVFGGAVKIRGTENEGTTVTVKIPLPEKERRIER